jgi:hypothetical protein
LLNWVSFEVDRRFDRALDELIAALDTDLDWLRSHTRLLVRAIEWEAARQSPSLLMRGEDLEAIDQAVRVSGRMKPEVTELQMTYLRASREAAEAAKRLSDELASSRARRPIRVPSTTRASACRRSSSRRVN